MLSSLLGGIGLFLLGMVLLTGGLKALAGDRLRKVLARFTGGPWVALSTGAGITAVVQSSSATTVATIGFVSAGLLSFPQAVGLIFGANLGTTSTSWLVSLFGLKLNVGAAALPVVGIGALMQLAGRARVGSAGLALAGFGLIFLGIDALQVGMMGLAEHLHPAAFPRDTIGSRLLLVAVGAAMTLVMQSSSAAAATTLTALHAGTIDLTQGASLVIGQNIGTTFTAVFAAVGASIPAKRTALAHVLFNLGTGIVALGLLPLFVAVVRRAAGVFDASDEAVSLAAFQTAFKLFGILLFMPFIRPYASWIERVIPERRPALARNLDRSVAAVAAVGVEAARRTALGIALALIDVAARRSRTRADGAEASLAEAEAALEEVRRFLSYVRSNPDEAPTHERHLAILHALDHLDRFAQALRDPIAEVASRDPDVVEMRELLDRYLVAARGWFGSEGESMTPFDLEEAARAIAEARRSGRLRVLRRAASGHIEADGVGEKLEAMRWVDRLAYHLVRASFHLRVESPTEAAPLPQSSAPDRAAAVDEP